MNDDGRRTTATLGRWTKRIRVKENLNKRNRNSYLLNSSFVLVTPSIAGERSSIVEFSLLQFRDDLFEVIEDLRVHQGIPVQDRSSVNDVGDRTLHLLHIQRIGGLRHLHDD